MELLVQTCKNYCSGISSLTQQAKQSLESFFLDLNNITDIIECIQSHTEVLICFNSMAKKQIRSGAYFGIDNRRQGGQINKEKQRDWRTYILQSLLVKLAQLPEHNDITQKNLYLSFLGMLLANYLCFNTNAKVGQQFFDKILTEFKNRSSKSYCLVTLYEMAKIIEAIIDQIKVLQKQYISPHQLYKNIWSFMEDDAPKLSHIIRQILESLSQFLYTINPQDIGTLFEGVKRVINSVFNSLESLHQLLRVQQSLEENTDDDELSFQKSARVNFRATCMITWQQQHIYRKVKIISNLINQLFNLQVPNALQKQTSICLLLNLLLEILKIYHKFYKSNNRSKYVEKQQLFLLYGPIFELFVFPHMVSIINYSQSSSQTCLVQNIESPILRILSQIIEYITEDVSSVSEEGPISNPQKIIIKYCEKCFLAFPPNYYDTQSCPYFLVFKIFNQLKYEKMLYCQTINISSIVINQINSYYDNVIRDYFKQYVIEKLLIPIDKSMESLQQQQQSNEIVDYYDYIVKVLPQYFKQFMRYSPKYMNRDNKTKRNPEPKHDCRMQQINQHLFWIQESSSGQQNENIENQKTDESGSIDIIVNEYCDDYFMISNLIDIIHEQYEKEIPDLIKTPSCNNYITNQTLPLLVLLHHIIKQITDSQMKCQLLAKFFELASQFQQKSFLESERSSEVILMQLNFCKLYLISKIIHQLMPLQFVNQGPAYSDYGIFIERKHGQNFVDYTIEALDNIHITFVNSYKRKCIASNNQYNECKETYEDLVGYGMSIFEHIAMIFNDRISEIQQNNISEEVNIYYQLLNNLKDVMEQAEYFTANSNFKVYCLTGLLINILNKTEVYQIYSKLRANTLENNQNLQMFFSGMAGLFKECYNKEKNCILAELCFPDLQKMVDNYLLDGLSDEVLESFIPFLKHLFSQKILVNCRSNLPFELQILLYDSMAMYVPEALMIPGLKTIAEGIYTNFALINNFTSQLLPLPDFHKISDGILKIYFENLDRVPMQSLSLLFRFAHKKVQYLIETLNYFIENKEQMEMVDGIQVEIQNLIDINNISNNFIEALDGDLDQLTGILHYYRSGQQIKEIRQTIRQRRVQIMEEKGIEVNKIRKSIKNAN